MTSELEALTPAVEQLLIDLAEMDVAFDVLTRRIDTLEAENAALKAPVSKAPVSKAPMINIAINEALPQLEVLIGISADVDARVSKLIGDYTVELEAENARLTVANDMLRARVVALAGPA